MARFSRIANDAIFLTGGLLLYSMVALGAFQHFFHAATAVWIVILAVLGYQIHQRRWRTFAMAATAVGLSSILLFLGCTMMVLASSTPMLLTQAFSSAGEFYLTIYIPFFWLPFALGAVTGNVVSFVRPNPGDSGSHQ